MPAHGPNGQFLKSGSSGSGGGSTAADDAAKLGESLGVAGTAAEELNGIMGSLDTESLSTGFTGLGSVSKGLGGLFDGLSSKVGEFGGAFGMSEQQIGGFQDTLGGVADKLGPIAAEADIVVAAIVALVGKLWELGKAAVALTQEKDAMRATFDVFTGGGGDALLGGLEDLAATLPFTGDKLNAWAKSLLAAGIQGEALNDSIRAVAAATAIMGESGGAAAEGLIKRFAMAAEAGQKVSLDRRILTQLAAAGVSVQALAKELGVAPEELGKMKIAAGELGAAMQRALVQQGAKSLAVMGQSWTSISAKLTEGWEDAFEDLGDIVGPFMAQLQSLASEFFAGSAAGGTLKDVIRAVLTPAFEIATRTVRAMHIAYLELLIAFLKAKIFLAPITSALGSIGVSGGIVNVVMYLLGATALILAVVLGVLALAVLLVAAPFIIAGLAIYGVVRAVQYLIGLFSGAVANFDNIKAAVAGFASGAVAALGDMASGAVTAAGNFVGGLVSGISSGAGAVADAVKALAASALSSFTSFFGIASHSKVMKKHGKDNLAGATAAGIDDGANKVDAAMTDMVGAPKGKGGRKGGGQRPIVRIGVINFNGRADEFLSFSEQMNAYLEELDAEGPEPEPAS